MILIQAAYGSLQGITDGEVAAQHGGDAEK